MTTELPPRPNAADVADALAWADRKGLTRLFSENFEGNLRAEILHLRVQLSSLTEERRQLVVGFEALNEAVGRLRKKVSEVTRAWMDVDRDELAADYPDLAGALDELLEHTGGE